MLEKRLPTTSPSSPTRVAPSGSGAAIAPARDRAATAAFASAPEWRLEERSGGTVAVAVIGAFELHAYRDYFIVGGPRSGTSGPAPMLTDAQHLAIDALRRYLAGSAVDGYDTAPLRAELDELKRRTL